MINLLLYITFLLSIIVGITVSISFRVYDFLQSLKIKIRSIMASQEQFQAAIDKIQAGIADLKAQLTNAGLTAEVEASVLAQLDAIAAGFAAPESTVEETTTEAPVEGV